MEHKEVKNCEIKDEILLMPNDRRFVLFPIEFHDIWKMYKKAKASFWTVEQVNLSKDIKDWKKLDKDEQHFIKHVLAFLSLFGRIVNENSTETFINEIQIPEARCFYGIQIAIENIHSEMYSLLIDTYFNESTERYLLLNAVQNLPCVIKKTKWTKNWTASKTATFAERLIAFAAIQGIYFSGSFASISSLKERNLLPGLTFSNDLISRNEGLHCNFACLLFNYIKKKPTQKKIYEIIKEAVEIEKEFLTDALTVNLIGINCELMFQYIEFVADCLLADFGCEAYFNTKNPLLFMDQIWLDVKMNFFEKKVSGYQRDNVIARAEEREFKLDADF